MTKENVTYVTLSNGRRISKWDYDCSKLPHSQRGKARSKFWEGVADAMADQWNMIPRKRLITLSKPSSVCTNDYALQGSYKKISLQDLCKQMGISHTRM